MDTVIVCVLIHCLIVLCFGNYHSDAQNDLKETIKKKLIKGKAKNVILFIGDGMGFETVTAARIYEGGESHRLSFEKFPFGGTLKTYSHDEQVPESAATATAMLTGTKVNGDTIGVNTSITWNICGGEKDAALPTLLQMANNAGMSTGIVTTSRITHATPGACYAKVANRNWESDYAISKARNYTAGKCVDIAKQLIDDHPYINVLLGGGRWNFMPYSQLDPEYGSSLGKKGHRDDGDLIQDWKDEKLARGVSHQYVWNNNDFKAVDSLNTDYILGLFERTHMMYEDERKASTDPDPTLEEMTQKAIEILMKNEDGFFLMVEGARIDHAHHASWANRALVETVEFAKAVSKAVSMTNVKDTLIVVTADHAHSLVGGGKASKGNPITDFDDRPFWEPDLAGLPMKTLGYHNGPGFDKDYNRRNLTNYDTKAWDFSYDAIYPTGSTTHSLFDVPAFTLGPHAHLFEGVHEQNYVAHVIAYASCIGKPHGFKSYCDTRKYLRSLRN